MSQLVAAETPGRAAGSHVSFESGARTAWHTHLEEIEDLLMREIRYLDKLIDELARGKPMEKILRDS